MERWHRIRYRLIGAAYGGLAAALVAGIFRAQASENYAPSSLLDLASFVALPVISALVAGAAFAPRVVAPGTDSSKAVGYGILAALFAHGLNALLFATLLMAERPPYAEFDPADMLMFVLMVLFFSIWLMGIGSAIAGGLGGWLLFRFARPEHGPNDSSGAEPSGGKE